MDKDISNPEQKEEIKKTFLDRIKDFFNKGFLCDASEYEKIIDLGKAKQKREMLKLFNGEFGEYLKSKQVKTSRRGIVRRAELRAQKIIDDAKTEAEKIKQEAIAECEEIKRNTLDECEEIKCKALEEASDKPAKTKLFSFFKFHKKERKNETRKYKENNLPEEDSINIVPVLRINITNFYNCITYQQIKRATDGIFKDDAVLPAKSCCPDEKEVRAVTGCEDPTITREATSAYFANYVLEGLENNFKRYAYLSGINYFRRHDDIFLVGDRERCKKIANYICQQLQIYNFTVENDKEYLSIKDKLKIREISKSEPYDIFKFYMNYVGNVDIAFYKELQKYRFM